jgi:hypothetical protein
MGSIISVKLRATARVGAVVLFTSVATAAPVRSEPVLQLTFDWPAPVTIGVSQHSTKNSRTAHLRYELTTERQAGDQSLVVRLHSFEFLELDGRPVTTPKAKATLAPVLAITALVPSFRVARDGRLLGIADFDLDSIVGQLRELTPQSRELQESLDQLQTSPEMRSQLRAKAADTWNTWVGFWRDLESAPAPGEVTSVRRIVAVFGIDVERHALVRNLGPADGCPRCVRLRSESTLDGPEFSAAMANMLRKFAGQSTGRPDLEAFLTSIRSVSRRDVLDAVTDPSTLRPASVTTESTMRLVADGHPPADQIERITYEFAWASMDE